MGKNLSRKCKEWKDTPLSINRKLTFGNITILLINVVLFLVTIIGGYNFMTEVNLVFSSFIALFIFLQIVFKNKLNLYVLSSYGILVFGTAYTFIIRGADSFGYRFGYNFGLSLLAIVCVTLLACIPKFKNNKVSYYVSRVTSFVMIGASLIYFLFANIRIKPTCVSLQDGHDDYLNKVKSAKSNDNDPNVLLILMDDMAFSDISSYSYLGEENATIKTPNIDSIGAKQYKNSNGDVIANNGIMMENCYAASPVSSPSRFSILTGRYSCRGYLDNVVFNTKQQNIPFSQTRFFNPFQLAHNVDGLLGDEITIAEALQADGYKTGLFGKWNLGDYGEYLPTNQGFDYFFGSHYINDMIPYNVVEEKEGEFEEVYSHQEMVDQSLSTERFTEKTLDFIKENASNGQKFFAEYASPWPHFPIYSNNNGNGEGDKTDDNYIDCIEEFDRHIGMILDYLRETDDVNNEGHKLYENTLIMFTSDNGPGREGVTGNLRGRKNTPFEGGYKVPFLAKLPDSVPARNDYSGAYGIQARCMNMDVLPTVLELCGIPLPDDRVIDGVSMVDLWKGKDKNGNDVAQDAKMHDVIYYFKTGSAKAISMPFDETVRDAEGKVVLNSDGTPKMVSQDYKFYRNVQTENSAFFNQFYKNYLFNLDADQAEGYNISMKQENLEKVEILRDQLEKFNKEIKNDTVRRGKLK